MIIAFVILLLALGMFLDGLAMMTLVIPIFLPITHEMGIDAIWFGILMVRTMEIGFVHPPVGMNVYIINLKSYSQRGRTLAYEAVSNSMETTTWQQ